MTKALIILAALGALAGPASAAESIKVSIAGKTPEAIHADILRAAQLVCFHEYATETLGYYMVSQCVARTVRETEAPLGMTAARPSPDKLALAR
jgi:hypothetical protein